jgi:hypothetical protein
VALLGAGDCDRGEGAEDGSGVGVFPVAVETLLILLVKKTRTRRGGVVFQPSVPKIGGVVMN